MKKRSSLIALMLAASLSITSVLPALAAEVPAEADAADTAVTASMEETAESGEAVEPEEAEPEMVSSDAEPEENDSEAESEVIDNDEEPEEIVNEAEPEEGFGEEVPEDENEDAEILEETEETEETKAPLFTGTITIDAEIENKASDNGSDLDPDELFAAYADRVFGGVDQKGRLKARKSVGSKLTGYEAVFYNYIASRLPYIAAGEQASTVFELSGDEYLEKKSWTAAELGVDSILVQNEDGSYSITPETIRAVGRAINLDAAKVNSALLADFPYELYWYDKVKSDAFDFSSHYNMSASLDGSINEYVVEVTGTFTVKLRVVGDYAVDQYTVNTEKGQLVQSSAANARAIVSRYSGYTDSEKLSKYREEICDLVSYNHEANMDDPDVYGDPWQMIWVFDNDPGTEVVCEGYSKAFKYLCDQSNFSADINCITVTGVMRGGTGAGRHMWNIVHNDDGRNYLVDVTNCDEGTIGAPDLLFMVPAEKIEEDHYQCMANSTAISYVYDADMHLVFSDEELEISSETVCSHIWSTEYTVDRQPTGTEEGIESLHCTVCNAVKPGSERSIPKLKIITPEAVADIANATYTGKPITPEVVVTVDGNVLTKDVDYTVNYSNNTNAGTAKVTIKGVVGKYDGNVEKTFTIAVKKVKPAITLAKTAYAYSGKVIKPAVTVKAGSTKLTLNKDYEVSYASGRKNVGTYKVVVKLKGNYSGNNSTSFKIIPKGTALVSLTPGSKKMTVKWKKQATQTTGYQIQVATDNKFTKNKKTVTVAGASKTSANVTGLLGGKKYYARIRTYRTVKNVKYYSSWSAMKATNVKK